MVRLILYKERRNNLKLYLYIIKGRNISSRKQKAQIHYKITASI